MGWKTKCALFLVGLTRLLPLQAQETPRIEEIYVFFNVPVYGGIDIPAILKENTLYLPVNTIFTFLKINQHLRPGLDTVSGFFLRESNPYLIDRVQHQVFVDNQLFILNENDFIRTESNLFLRMDWYGKIFGLECSFDFITLTVTLNTRIELPFIREFRQEQMRNSVARLKGSPQADSTYLTAKKWLHLGAVDWSVLARHQIGISSDVRLNLTFGGVIAKGSANLSINYNSGEVFSGRQQYYLWHYANNRNKVIRQVYAGRVSVNPVSTLRDPLTGILMTNTPTGFRRSFCSYTLSDYTEPGWMVELYVNHMLIDYTKADASGFFTFEVPLTYGNTQVMLRFYGPWGEERTWQQYISIPYHFLPPGKLEYSMAAGILEDAHLSRFGRVIVNYGISRQVSATLGMEYLSSVTPGEFMPIAGFSWRAAPTLLLTGEYVHGVKSTGLLSYRLPGDLLFEMKYVNYVPGQMAINTNFLEERKFMASMPVRKGSFGAYLRFILNQTILPSFQNVTGELLISGVWAGLSFNATTFALFSKQLDPLIYSTLSIGLPLPAKMNLIPQAQFEYTTGQFVSAKAEIEKRTGQMGSLSVSFEHNFYSKIASLMATFRYNLPFTQTTLNAFLINGKPGLSESFSGSLLIDPSTSYYKAKNRSSVGRGGIVVIPFMDINNNGIRDKGEPKAQGLSLKSYNGVIEQDRKDTVIRITDLEPYTTYFLELNPGGFESVAWRIRQTTINVPVEPNQFRLITIPVQIVGEVSGRVLSGSAHSGFKGKGRILVCIYDSESRLIARTLTEQDGFFSYLGLLPGKYLLRFDLEQLKKSKLSSLTTEKEFTIHPDRNGDISSGHELFLAGDHE